MSEGATHASRHHLVYYQWYADYLLRNTEAEELSPTAAKLAIPEVGKVYYTSKSGCEAFFNGEGPVCRMNGTCSMILSSF